MYHANMGGRFEPCSALIKIVKVRVSVKVI